MNQHSFNSSINVSSSKLESNKSSIDMSVNQISMPDYPGLSVAITADVCYRILYIDFRN